MSREKIIDPIQPRRNLDKRKHHSRGFSEGVDENRAQRIGFKRYLRELEEESLLDNDEDDSDTE